MTQRKLAEILREAVSEATSCESLVPAECYICSKDYDTCDGHFNNDVCIEGIREWLISQNRGASS